MRANAELSGRKAAILQAVVEGYISTARPVGSGYVARTRELDVSSATIRKELVALERDGFLYQPHTSAGRIPTEKGYREFVDGLMQPYELQPTDARRISDFFAHAHGELERILKQTSGLLAGLTHYAAVVVGPDRESTRVRSVQLVGLSDRMALAVIVLSSGRIEKQAIELPEGVDAATLGAAGRVIAERLIGQPLPATGAVPRSGDPVVDPVVDRTWEILGTESAGGEQLFVGGVSQMASMFDEGDTLRSVLDMLEQQYLVVSLVRDVLDRGLQVAIGTETGVEDLNDCSLVVAPYELQGSAAGSIGVLGPTHMNYPQALAAVALVSQQLGTTLSER